MQPAVPDDPFGQGGPDQGGAEQQWLSADDVGAFTQGTAFSRWALARYLVGQAIGSSVSDTLMLFGVLWLALAAVAQFLLHLTWLAVVLVLVAFGTLAMRWLVRTLLGRLTDARRYGPVEQKLASLVGDTHRDVMQELRRLGLPSHTLTLPLLAVRLIGKRRKETVARLRQFETERAVPASRLDELHMLLQRGEIRG